MARSVYFAFDYEDVKSFRANVVRNSYVFNRSKFKDSSIWEESKEKTVRGIKQLIDKNLVGTSVTCVLIGSRTYSRRFVRYEIVKSFIAGKGLLGVGINWIKDRNGNTKFWPDNNPFEYIKLKISNDGTVINFFEYSGGWIPYRDVPAIRNNRFPESSYGKMYRFDSFFTTYSYDWNNGNRNFFQWIEEAAGNMGR